MATPTAESNKTALVRASREETAAFEGVVEGVEEVPEGVFSVPLAERELMVPVAEGEFSVVAVRELTVPVPVPAKEEAVVEAVTGKLAAVDVVLVPVTAVPEAPEEEETGAPIEKEGDVA